MSKKVKYKVGYKGKGMCKHCCYGSKVTVYGPLWCGLYICNCALVARNCTGIKNIDYNPE